MNLSKEDRDRRIAALTRLALATREFPPVTTAEDRKAMSAFFLIYLEDTASFPGVAVVEACRRLERKLSWFPKVAELVEECRLVAQMHADRTRPLRQLPEPVSEEKRDEFLRQIRQFCKGRRLR